MEEVAERTGLSMRIRLALIPGLISLIFAAVPVPALADVVYLVNGRSFEGVLAEEVDSQVYIRMPGGELRLPKSQVERVEKGESSFAEYLRRKGSLRRGADARGWLALAEWARARGLQHGTREAALRAAEVDPELAGLGPILRGLGYVHDQELGRWIPYSDSMRRRGFVQVGGQWLSREEMAERQRLRDEEAQRRAVREATEAAAAASRAQRALVELTLYREALRESAPPPPYPYYAGTPVVVWPGYGLPAFDHHRPPHHGRPDGHAGRHRPHKDLGYGQFRNRQPGSIIPLEPPRSSRPPSGHSGRPGSSGHSANSGH
jgi:hypothetical protein